MARPTISDVAEAAEVSESTVKRVMHEPERVREQTIAAVVQAAEKIGFYGLESLRGGMSKTRSTVRIGALLLQQNRALYHALGKALEEAAAAVSEREVRTRIEYLTDLSPESFASGMTHLAEESDVIAVVAADHPTVAAAIDTLAARAVPVFGLISPLTATAPVGYVGLDNSKVGRTSAWAFDRLCPAPGKIGILVGSHRYRSQELNESGFRSFFREHQRGFALLEAVSTYESATIAHELTERLLRENDDLAGLYISGGGVTGALAALRESGRANEVVAVGYERMDATREALIDGTLDFVIAHPLETLARTAVLKMIEAVDGEGAAPASVMLPFDILTSENL